MQIICPILGRDEKATNENIEEIIRSIENKEDPFVILARNDMTYMQALWTPKGFDLEYQEESIWNHYRLTELTTKEDVIWALQSYLKGEPYWKSKFKFEKKEITTIWFKIGHKLGRFFGKYKK